MLTLTLCCADAPAALPTEAKPDGDVEPPHDDAMVERHTAAALDGNLASSGSTAEASAEPIAVSKVEVTDDPQQAASMAVPAATVARHAALDSAMAALAAMVAQPAVSGSAAGDDRKGSATDSQTASRAAAARSADRSAERAADGAPTELEQVAAPAGAAVEAELAGASSTSVLVGEGSAAAEPTAEEYADIQQPVQAANDSGLTGSKVQELSALQP